MNRPVSSPPLVEVVQWHPRSQERDVNAWRLNRQAMRRRFLLVLVLTFALTNMFDVTTRGHGAPSLRNLWGTLMGPSTTRRERNLLELSLDHVDRYPFSNLADVTDPFSSSSSDDSKTPTRTDLPFYWQIPRAGGTTLKYVMGKCLNRVQASRTAHDYCDMESNALEICTTPKEGRFVNADPSDHVGLERCRNLGLSESGLVDVVVSSRFMHAASLFNADHKGRMFTMMRDPVERAASTFYYLQEAPWERLYSPELKDMSLVDYARRESTASNWMVRWLTGKNTEPELSDDDLKFAQEVLRRKFLVLLTDDMPTSVTRLVQYFNWTMPDAKSSAETRLCLRENVGKANGHNKNRHEMPKKGSPEYEALLEINQFDMKLYEYAVQLFSEQWSMIYQGVGVQLENGIQDVRDVFVGFPETHAPATPTVTQ